MTETVSARYFEDYVANSTQEVGPIFVTEEDIIDFAQKYDPQYFHIDPEKALAGPYGGLIASGWHTASLVMGAMVKRFLDNASSLGSPGVDELRWLAPVRPRDQLSVRVGIRDTRRSNSKPDRGFVHTLIETFNQEEVLVMTMKATTIIRCRVAGDI